MKLITIQGKRINVGYIVWFTSDTRANCYYDINVRLTFNEGMTFTFLDREERDAVLEELEGMMQGDTRHSIIKE